MTIDKLVDAIKEQGKQIEELQQNLKELNKVSIKKLDENKQETKQWSSLFENKVGTLITDVEKIQGSVSDTTSKIEIKKKDREHCKKLLAVKLNEVNQKGGSKK